MDGEKRRALRRCVVVGAGAVGRLVAGALESAAEVVMVDSRPADDVLVADVRWPGYRVRCELEQADAVVLALPLAAACDAVDRLTPLLRADALLVDTTSVKSTIVGSLRRARCREALSINPMFRPDLGMRGHPVAVVPVRRGPRGTALLAVLARQGVRVVELSAAEHDAFTAATQAAGHAAVLAFGRALQRTGADVELVRALAPPPAQVLLALLGRITSGEPEVYWDVQAGNPAAPAARRELAMALERLESLVSRDDPNAFAGLLTELGAYLAPHQESLVRRCAALFAEVPAN